MKTIKRIAIVYGAVFILSSCGWLGLGSSLKMAIENAAILSTFVTGLSLVAIND